MKSLIIAAALLGAALSAQAQTNVSIDIGQPGFYGRIELGDFRQPPVVYTQPVIVERHARAAGQPLYLRVPPGHMKKWSRHCARYQACGRQVYFVRDDWYTNTYAPRYRELRGGRDGRDGRGDYRGRDDHRGRDEQRGFDGNDKGHGGGHDRGHGGGKDKGPGHDRGHGNGNGKH